MDFIRLIRSPRGVPSSQCIELLPGEYADKCWNEGSLFIELDTWGFFERSVMSHAYDYDRFSITPIDEALWYRIMQDFAQMKALLQSAESASQLNDKIGFYSSQTEAWFAEDFDRNRCALIAVIDTLSVWIEEKADSYGCVSVIGL